MLRRIKRVWLMWDKVIKFQLCVLTQGPRLAARDWQYEQNIVNVTIITRLNESLCRKSCLSINNMYTKVTLERFY